MAERARQGRLRAVFMKQIFLQEYRAKQARLLGEKVPDEEAAAVCIQKVRMCGAQSWGARCLDAARNLRTTVGSALRN